MFHSLTEQILQQAHELVLCEVRNEIEQKERQIAILKRKERDLRKQMCEERLRVMQIESDFVWMIGN